MYGFAGGDPVNYSDPFGLCKDAKGKDRECLVTWARRHKGDEEPDAATMAVARELALRADVDLQINSGRRSPSTDCSQPAKKREPSSRHNCGLAFDISAIIRDGQFIDIGTDLVEANMSSLAIIISVAAKALDVDGVNEVLSPAGLFYRSPDGAISHTAARNWTPKQRKLYKEHWGHIHVSIHTPSSP